MSEHITNGRPDLSAFDAVDFDDAEHRQIAIVGTGPAGWTAALYTARANLEPVVFQGDIPGGQLMTTTDVENYPGFPDGVMGPDMMMKFEEQARRFGADVRYGMVTNVDFSTHPFRLIVDEETPLLADAVIIATGASAKYLGLENEKRLLGRGVSACATCDGAFFRDQDVAIVGGGDTAMEEALLGGGVSACATCDGFFFKDKHVIVVGGGDSAMEEATFLTKFASKVTVVHRRSELRASKIMQERAFKNDKIEFMWNTVVTDVLGEDGVEGLAVENTETGETSTLDVQGFFVAIGHKPNTEIFEGWLDMDAQGYLKTKADSTYTNVEGVFASGDAQDHVYRQAVTAAGTGCMAAIDAERWLAERGEIDEPRTETEYHAAPAIDSAEQAG